MGPNPLFDFFFFSGLVMQVVEVSTSKTGKHGHAKCHFVGIDIFTAKKLEDIVPSSHNCDVRTLFSLRIIVLCLILPFTLMAFISCFAGASC